MIKKKKILNTVCVSVFLLVVLVMSSFIEGEATNSILPDGSNFEESNIQSNVNSEESSENIQPNVNSEEPSEEGLKAEDFLNEEDLPKKEGGDNWVDYMYAPEDFLVQDKVTIKDFENKILTRMLEVVSLFQTFARPFCVILFVLCSLGILMSIVFDTKKQKTFMLGLILSVISYVAIMYAPTLVLFFSNWLSF